MASSNRPPIPIAGPPRTITATQPGFGRIDAVSRKLACIIPITNDLMRFAVEALDEQLGEMFAAEIAVAEDLQFIRGQGYQNTPRGLAAFAAMAPSASGIGAANVIQSAGVTASEIVLDLQAAIYALLQASVGMIKPAWIMSPATSTYLQILQNSDGLFIFKEMSLKGTLLRKPFFETIQIPTNLTVGGVENCSELYLFDASEALIFDGADLEIAVATSADWTDANNLFHAGFAEDVSLIRAVAGRDFQMKHVMIPPASTLVAADNLSMARHRSSVANNFWRHLPDNPRHDRLTPRGLGKLGLQLAREGFGGANVAASAARSRACLRRLYHVTG
jgi:hypothetical protein